METLLTIFTPTYNRSHTLPILYDSLLNQTDKNFKWLIVDDGSKDNTEVLVTKWIEIGLIDIKYIKQKNQGKHIAHNTGVENCKTKLFFCVDSDDYLLPTAVEEIMSDIAEINSKNICGIVSTRVNTNLRPLVKEMPKDIRYSSLSDLYEKYKFKGDTALIFKTSILKKYRFPKIQNEKFIGEEYLYCQIDTKYKLYVTQNKYYVCKYLDDGYTKNITNLIKKNPKGYMLLKRTKLNESKSFISQYKAAALYIVGAILSREKHFIRNSPRKLITILSIPLAIIIYFVRFKIR